MESVIKTMLELTDRLDGRLTAVTVQDARRSDEERELLGSYAYLVHNGGGDFVTLEARNPAKAPIVAYARTMLATTVARPPATEPAGIAAWMRWKRSSTATRMPTTA